MGEWSLEFESPIHTRQNRQQTQFPCLDTWTIHTLAIISSQEQEIRIPSIVSIVEAKVPIGLAPLAWLHDLEI